jgi:hypothetical protein
MHTHSFTFQPLSFCKGCITEAVRDEIVIQLQRHPTITLE